MSRSRFRTAFTGAALLAALGLAGCSGLSEKECLATDWQTVGYEDGVRGRSADRIGDVRKACAEHGIRADLDAYRSGRAEGLREYCRPANGYRVGVSGAEYTGVCPADLEPAFVDAYTAGHRRYVLEARVQVVDETLSRKRRQLHDVEHGVADAAIAAVDDRSTPQQRMDAVIDTAQRAERVGRLKQEIRELEVRRAESVRALDEYLAANGDWSP